RVHAGGVLNFSPAPDRVSDTRRPMNHGHPKAPRGLSPESRELWAKTHATWPMDVAGRAILKVILQSNDRGAKAHEIVDREGFLKGTRAQPLLATIRDCAQISWRGWRHLGLEPPSAPGRPPGRGPA